LKSRFAAEDLLAFWRQVVDPQSVGMPESIAGDIASYTGEPVAVVLHKMESGKEDLKRLWEASKIDTSDPSSIERFYRDQFVEAYELADWHCGRANGIPPLTYAWAAKFAQQKGLKRVLDFGSGIGTGALCLTVAGCEVHLADVARELLKLAGHRLRRRGYVPNLIDMTSGSRPRSNYYDLIVCFDVLEHVPDQVAKLRELASYLRNGGYLLANFMFSSSHPEHPMHISSAPYWDLLVRKTPMVPVWSSCDDQVQVLKRTPYAFLRNHLAEYADRLRGHPGTPGSRHDQ